jgi:ribose 5-phosphate isomerase B
MKIALGSDHRGADAVRSLVEHLRDAGHDVMMLGPTTNESSDYPDGAFLVARAVSEGDAERGILVCGSGIGVSMAANKVPGVRAALVFDETAAKGTRQHNDANVLCLSGDRTERSAMPAIVDAFLATEFEGGRHARRVDKLGAIERGEDPNGIDAHAQTSG